MGRTSMPENQRKPKQSRYYAAEKKRKRQKRNKVLIITVAAFFLCLLVVAGSAGIGYVIFRTAKNESPKKTEDPAQTASAMQTVPKEEDGQTTPEVQTVPEKATEQMASAVQAVPEEEQTGPEEGQSPEAMEPSYSANTLEGRWSGDGVLIYQFDGNESGLLQSTVGEYAFQYTLQDQKMLLTFQDAPIKDKEFEYSLKDGKLYFKDLATGQSFVFNRIG